MLQVFYHTNFRMMWGAKYLFLIMSIIVMLVAIGTIAIRG